MVKAIRQSDGLEVIIKTSRTKYINNEELLKIKREFDIIRQFDSESIIKCYDFIKYKSENVAIVFEYFGISLNKYLSQLPSKIIPTREFFPLAIKLLEAVTTVHKAGIIHNNIETSNFLIESKTKNIKLIDFDLSSFLSQEFSESSPLKDWSNKSLPYLSPEQTGRINRGVDYRSDFYALGVVFYEMLTGKTLFDSKDDLEWVYSIISKEPLTPDVINKNVPQVVCEIILKLVSKNAENRYQSSHGILQDLKKAEEQTKIYGTDFHFEIAKSDVSEKFKIPQELYGREKEIEKLKTYFDNINLGSVEFCLVSGYSGVGKTSLVNELGRSVAQKNGYLIQGKFDQFKQNSSYTTLINAFSNLIKLILDESKERLAFWKLKILEALDGNAQLIIDYIPELEVIIGSQQSLPSLPVEESQARFISNFINFINVFGSKNYPLVLFLDDLQWSDSPTLHLIKQLVLNDKLNYTFIIGAYRDNEVEATHPLNLTIREIEKRRYVENLNLQPLNKSATNSLVSDTLHCDKILARKVTQKVYEKTYGNPFFTIELLKNLKEKQVIYFDYDKSHWNCDISNLEKEEYSDNVIGILVRKQLKLKETTQKALQIASCIGANFDLKTLSTIQNCALEQSGVYLQDALLDNMIIPLDENYKFYGNFDGDKVLDSSVRKNINPKYKFQHDRIQQAAYSQITEAKKEVIHLLIGKLQLEHISEIDSENQFLGMIDHLNTGRRLIDDEEFRIKVAKLNLEAGTKAKESSAYKAALSYLNIGTELLGNDSWSKNYQLSWEFHKELQHCYYLTGNIHKADKLLEVVLQKSNTPIEKALIISTRTRQFITTQRITESIHSAFEGLSILDFEIKKEPSEQDIEQQIEQLRINLKNRKISELIHLPEISDNKAKIASQLLNETFAAAFISGNSKMLTYLVLKSVNIGLVYGNSPEIAFSYTVYGMLLCGKFNDLALGYQYGKLGVSLSYKLENIALRTRIVYVYTMFVHHWSYHWSSMTPWFRKGIDAGYQTGDLLYLAYSAQDCVIWDPTLDLETITTEQKKLLEIVKDCDYKDSLDSGTLILQMHLNLMGLTEDLFSFSDKDYDENTCLKGMHERHFMTGICNYHLYKAEIHFIYNDSVGALPHILKVEEHLAALMSLPQITRYQIIAFLVRAQLVLNEYADKKGLLSKMTENEKTVAKWVEHCPENFKHLHMLMLAEIANIENDFSKALKLYDQAIESAKLNNYRKDEAMINEMAGKFFLRHNFSKAAEGYLKESQYLYHRWGAQRKVEEMASKYATSIENTNQRNIYSDAKIKNVSEQDDFLDIKSILKASQTISGELALDKLLNSTLNIILENAGAQRGFILMQKENKLELIEYRDNFEKQQYEIYDIQDKQGNPLIPFTLINNTIRTQETIVIDHVNEIHPFSSDPYFKKHKPYSLSCFPLPKHGKWPMVIYLENNITFGAFTNERVKVTNLLASQASISMENARIYQQQEQLLKAQQRFVPSQFLKHLGHDSIINVKLGESVFIEMNVLFLDILNFTSLVEKISPEEVIQILNELFNELGIVIKHFGGFIDSYQGDQIMALFPSSCFNAVKAATEMTKALFAYNQSSKNNELYNFNIGIGINTGPLVLGTMGATERMQCSVLGDTVNLASRIENLTRVYGAKLLIGENTYDGIEDKKHFGLRMVDYVAVKGKEKPVKIYEVLNAESKERRLLKEKTLDLVNKGTELYYAQDFSSSEEIFKSALKIDPEDDVIQIFIERINFYKKNTPDKNWKGFEVLNQK